LWALSHPNPTTHHPISSSTTIQIPTPSITTSKKLSRKREEEWAMSSEWAIRFAKTAEERKKRKVEREKLEILQLEKGKFLKLFLTLLSFFCLLPLNFFFNLSSQKESKIA
jgi:hypothetical protein